MLPHYRICRFSHSLSLDASRHVGRACECLSFSVYVHFVLESTWVVDGRMKEMTKRKLVCLDLYFFENGLPSFQLLWI
jgi:hypothetical protein